MMFESATPSLAKKAMIVPPGEIEGPSLPTVEGLVCKAANNPTLQKECSHFITRTAQDNLDDEDL